mmetsp:Transcript_11252/g.21182  ORF Transcript_11252/g.21182 Transcript_11252/m.21182 type:complete len:137 (-) Transcript_11252:194-604(-)
MATRDNDDDISLMQDLTSIPLKGSLEHVADDDDASGLDLSADRSSFGGSRSMKQPTSSRKDTPKQPLSKPAFRNYDYYYDHDDYPPDEPFRWSDAWGLICGLILLVFIVCVLTWAYLEDLREARELEEAKARGVEL